MIPLRPLSVGEVLEGSLGVYRRHWRLLVPVSAVLALATALATLPYVWAMVDALRPLLELDPDTATDATVEAALDDAVGGAGALGASLVLASVVTLVALVVLLGVVTVVTGQAVLGRPAPWPVVRARVRTRLMPLLGTALVVGGALLALNAVGVGLLVASYAVLGWAGLALGTVAVVAGLLPLWAYLTVRWVVAAPAAVLESASPLQALRRSWSLVAGHWWRTLGLLVLVWLIYAGVSTVVSTPLTAVAQLGTTPYSLDGSIDPDVFLALLLVSLLASVVTNALVYPFVGAAVALTYLNLRMRKEGLAEQLATAATADRA